VAPADPPPAAVSTAEFEVEVEGEMFKVRVTGTGMTVTPGAGASPAGTATAAPPPKSGEGTVIAPMQGLIVKLPVKAGDSVKLGDVVAVLEAMKMQNDIVTTVAGRVSQVYVKEGEVVSPNQPLLAVG
jgi:biotin carboxyl carrier protein